MTRLRGGLLAAALVSLLALGACTSSVDNTSAESDSATSAQADSGAATQEGGGAGQEDGGGTAPAQGEEDLTGGTPDETLSVEAEPGAPLELTKQEEAFLSAMDVPADIYDGAVLEAGYEACLRIEATASVDEAVLREALASGEIADAEPAIRTLCPEFEQYLPAG